MTRSVKNLKAVFAATIGCGAIFIGGLAPSDAVAQATLPDQLSEALQSSDQAPRLSDLDEAGLLEALRDADPQDSQRVERELQALWSKSGSPAMDLLLRRGVDALERGEIDVALEHLTALTDHAPAFAEGWAARANVFAHAGKFGPALADLQQALVLNPNDYNAIFALGQMLELFDDYERAHEAYLYAKSIHPNHEEVGKALDRLSAHVGGEAL